MIVFTKTDPQAEIEDTVVQHKRWLNSLHVERGGINSKLVDDLISAVAVNQKKIKQKRVTKPNEKRNGNTSD